MYKFLGSNTVMPHLSTRTRGRVEELDVETDDRASDTNPDPVEMSDRTIQVESQPIACPARSNDDVLGYDSRVDTDVSDTTDR